MTKYQQYFQDMLENNKEVFDAFKNIHDNYAENPEKWKSEFNEKGQEVLQIVRRYENMLCGKSEAGMYGKYSSQLSEKFWVLVRGYLPRIDFVGVL